MEEKMRAMANLGHRVLPPQLLLKWPKEASFCQLLMHPVLETRPKMRNGARKLLGILIAIGEAVAYVLSGMYGMAM
ncbi:hypothetical protein PR202_gb23881 [Eleusine coracana subsp. coracana]|uniref:Uncharacterized protein n=1 Tax=Eleusine coracana subsp. coracana TaxID=191504 RepID=A0AAV5FK33_ELECO|nr:hypothetical protein PR202_gb23881 [Eleusine coracana subsp. coracana]